MGILIGKETDSGFLQYLTSLVVNKGKSNYIRVNLIQKITVNAVKKHLRILPEVLPIRLEENPKDRCYS